VSETKVTPVPAVAPNLTVAALVNPVPVIVTVVPPNLVPLVGEMLVTVGATPVYVNRSLTEVALVPPGVVTVTSTVPPVALAGEIAVIEVALLTVNEVADVPPNLTAVAPVNPVPVIVTEVPPAAGPLVGEMPVTVGAAE
jgi:hypothetical protein